jgi:hypothetical protein
MEQAVNSISFYEKTFDNHFRKLPFLNGGTFYILS